MKRRSFTKPELARIILGLRQGQTVKQVADAEGRTVSTVTNSLKHHTGKYPGFYQRESKHTRLCQAQVLEEAGYNRQQISQALGCSPGTVSRILIQAGARKGTPVVGDARVRRDARIVQAWLDGRTAAHICNSEQCTRAVLGRALRAAGIRRSPQRSECAA